MLTVENHPLVVPMTAPPLVVIDVSRSSQPALLEFVRGLREDRLSYLLVLRPSLGRADPSRGVEDDLLAKLDRAATLSVRRASHGVALVPGHVFVLFPTHSASLRGRLLYLASDEPGQSSADRVFAQLARTRGAAGAAVLLANTNPVADYQATGLTEVRRAGGAVFTPAAGGSQLPSYDATWPGYFGHYETPDQLGAALACWQREMVGADLLETQLVNRLAVRLSHRYGFSLAGMNEVVVRRLLCERMQRHACTLRGYVALIESSRRELDDFCDDLLPEPDTCLPDPDLLLPLLGARGCAGPALRAWNVGCGHGQQAYSLAIALWEQQQLTDDERPLRVFATDAHPARIARAREGLYPPHALAHLRGELIDRHFERTPGGYRVRRHLRDCVLFQRHDVLHEPPYMQLHYVLCSYEAALFEPLAWARVLAHLRFAVNGTGTLLLQAAPEPACQGAVDA